MEKRRRQLSSTTPNTAQSGMDGTTSLPRSSVGSCFPMPYSLPRTRGNPASFGVSVPEVDRFST